MCLAPILIKNPYYHCDSVGINYLHDTLSRYISVPCGSCSQCISLRQGYFNQRIQMESLRSELFFFTLTYANRGLKFTDIGDYKIPYPYFRDIQNLFHYLRNDLPHKIRTLVVSEYGTNRKRPHYHGYIAVSKDDIKTHYRGSHVYCEKVLYRKVFQHWKRNLSTSRKNPVYMPLSDFVYKNGRCTFDLHWVEPIREHDNDVSFYLTKYLLKYDSRTEKLLYKIRKDTSLNDDETKKLVSMIKPRCVMSKDFGSWKLPEVKSYISKCIDKVSDYPTFIDINTGRTMLLSPYYRNHLLPMSFKDNQWKDYVRNVPKQNRFSLYFSMNLDLLDDSSVHDFNCKSAKARSQDVQLRKVKNLQNKSK